jgi:c-di-GMP-binding flagellar brake protein YcgR
MLSRLSMAIGPASPERRRYRRLHAPILIRPVSALAYRAKQKVNDISLGGLRAYSDEEQKPGRRLELELFFSDETSATVLAEVVWVIPLAEGAPARFDVGLRFVDANPEDLERIARMLGD